MTTDFESHIVSSQGSFSEPTGLQNLIDSIPALVARIDCNMILEYVNRPFRKWFSQYEDAVCTSFPVIVGKEIFGQVQKHLGTVLVGQPAEFGISFSYKGSNRHMTVTLSPEFDSRHRVRSFIFHGTDISKNVSVQRDLPDFVENATIDMTAEKLAAEAVRESETRFKVMANLVPLIIWNTDENGLCTFLNTKWNELTGRSVEAGLGTLWLDVVHSEDRQNIEMSWNKSLSERRNFEGKFRMRNARNEYTISYVNSIPRFDSNNCFIGYVGIMQDVTSEEHIKSSLERMVLHRIEDLKKKNLELQNAEQELKAKNQELETTNNELSSFAHVASHDLQEPLRKIQIFTHRVITSEGDKLSLNGKDAMSTIQRSSFKMRALIQDILLYSKTNDLNGKTELTDLNELFGEVLAEFEIKIEETGASIENRGLPTLPVIRFQFHQLFLNLISNALKFSKPGCVPRVLFQTSLVTGDKIPGMSGRDNFYKISVSDNGIGFEEQYAEKIFQMFGRLHPAAHYEGTGIGLAICKKIVERHRGKMMAEGKVNEGSTFNIYLPV